MMAKALLANAPIKEINKSSFGMPMARPANKKSIIKYLMTMLSLRTCHNNNYCTKNSQFVVFVPFT